MRINGGTKCHCPICCRNNAGSKSMGLGHYRRAGMVPDENGLHMHGTKPQTRRLRRRKETVLWRKWLRQGEGE